MGHIHSIYDTDPHFTIDPVTRQITNKSNVRTTLVQGDHNSERFTFELPKTVEGHDMSQSTRIEVHYINISHDKAHQSEDVYIIDDMQISPNSEDVLIFSWLLSGNATRYAGTLAFAVRFICTTGETVDYAWHTAPHKGISITEGINVFDSPDADYSDVLASWESALNNKLDKLPSLNSSGVYMQDDEGNVTLREVSEHARAWSVGMRGTGGTFAVGTPTADEHAVPKGVADARYVEKVSAPDTYVRAYGVHTDGSPVMMEVTAGNTGNAIVRRDASGNARFGTPTEDNHSATKKYVDDLVASSGGSSIEVVQETGESTEAVMSQGAVTTALEGKEPIFKLPTSVSSYSTYAMCYSVNRNSDDVQKKVMMVTPNNIGGSILARSGNYTCTLSGTPTSPDHITNKRYVDGLIDGVENATGLLDERITTLETGSGGSSGGWIDGYSEDASLLYVSISCTGGWKAPNVIIPQRLNPLGIVATDDFYFTAYHVGYDEEEDESRVDGFGGGQIGMYEGEGESDFSTGGLINGTFTRFSATASVIAYKL